MQLKFGVLLFLFCGILSESVGYLTEHDHNCLLSYQIGRRRPTVIAIDVHEVAIYSINVPMARHHIIPFSVLRNFYNTILSANDRQVQTNFLHFLRNLRNAAGFTLPGFDDPEYHQILANARNSINEPPSVDWFTDRRSYANLIHQLYTWIPFNIFEGPLPEHRLDDPHDSFEINSRQIIGEEHYANMLQLNTVMSDYISRRQIRDAHSAINMMENLLRTRSIPFPFNYENWIMQEKIIDDNDIDLLFRIRTQNDIRKRSIEKDITYKCSNGKCTIKFHFVSTVLDDPICARSFQHIKDGLGKRLLLSENNTVWDLEDLHLLQANELLNSVTSLKASQYNNWRDWLKSEQNSNLANVEPLIFRDVSFVVPYKAKCAASSPCPSVMIFDRTNRPIAKLIQNQALPLPFTDHFLYQYGNWHKSQDRKWMEKITVDYQTPQLDLPRLKVQALTNDPLPLPNRKIFEKDDCELKVQSSAVFAGILAGATVGSAIPGLGTLFGTLIGLIGGVASGYLSGTVTSHAVC